MNYFNFPTAAHRYAQHRPYHHPVVIEQIRQYLQLTHPVSWAVDVACGTGMSTQALAPLAQNLMGCDVAPAMLAQAPVLPGVFYTLGRAEQLPLPTQLADLITVSSALHWLNRPLFLAEVGRVLKPGGWLVVYKNFSKARMVENEEYTHWFHQIYRIKYPPPARDSRPLTAADCTPHGLQLMQEIQYENEVQYTAEQFASYLMTQSNLISAIEAGQQTTTEIFAWLMQQLTPYFPQTKATFVYGGEIVFIQKLGSSQ